MSIRATTRVIALLGWPVEHSWSPLMHNAAFAAAGLDFCYIACPTPPAALPAALDGLHALGIAGANLTIPHKEAGCALVDTLDDEARAIGAVNTIVVREGSLAGSNTDAAGIADALADAGVTVRGAGAVVLGAGGSARAAVWALARAGAARIWVCARALEKAETVAALAPQGSAIPWSRGAVRVALAAADLLVNATPAGLTFDAKELPLDDEALAARHTVFDFVYQPALTALEQRARARAGRVLGGRDLLVAQGAASFTRWTGQPAPRDAMRNALPPVEK